MELKDTILLMTSADFKDRFLAEYHQLHIRYLKLRDMVSRWDNLEFKPTCPKTLYKIQLNSMESYLDILKVRAKMEDIDIDEDLAESRVTDLKSK